MLYHLLSNLHDKTDNDGREIYDALAVGMLIKPEMYTIKPAYVVVDTKSPYAYGASVIDFDNFFNQQANVEVGVAIDQATFANWFIEAIKKAEWLR